MIQNTELTAMLRPGCRALSEVKFSAQAPMMRLPDKMMRYEQACLKAARQLPHQVARTPGPQEARDQTQYQSAQTLKNSRQITALRCHEQYADQIENRGSEGPGQTQLLGPQAPISGLTSMWESRSGCCAQIVKVQSGWFLGSSTSDGGMLPR